MPRHSFVLIFASLLVGSNALAIDEITLPKSNLEREQAAIEEQQEESDLNLLLVLVLIGALGVPVVVTSMLLINRKEPSRPVRPSARAESPKPRV